MNQNEDLSTQEIVDSLLSTKVHLGSSERDKTINLLNTTHMTDLQRRVWLSLDEFGESDFAKACYLYRA